MSDNSKYLVTIAGPTGIGKSALALQLAQILKTEICSADSRQVYKELIIGTGKPSPKELSRVKHHFINHISIRENYNVQIFENECITLLNKLFFKHNIIILTGGTALYIHAVLQGIDSIPDVSITALENAQKLYRTDGILGLQNELRDMI